MHKKGQTNGLFLYAFLTTRGPKKVNFLEKVMSQVPNKWWLYKVIMIR